MLQGMLCGCEGCDDSDACTDVFAGCVYAEGLSGCEGGGNTGVENGGAVIGMSA